jgi:hypothetical protein
LGGKGHVLEVAAAKDEDPVEALGANRAHPAFGEGVCVCAWIGLRITLMPRGVHKLDRVQIHSICRKIE